MIHRRFTTSRLGTTGAALLALTTAACGGPQEAADADADFEGIPELGQPLTACGATITFSSATGALSVAFPGGSPTCIIAKRVSDCAILVSGVQQKDAVTNVLPTSTTVKTIAVTGGAGNADTLIIDFANGTFSPGTATVVGITVASTVENFKFRGQSGVDTVTLGITGTVVGMAAATVNKDITIDTVVASTLTFALGAGKDVFSTGGNTAVGTTLTKDVTVYGGEGDDTFNEGATANGKATIYGGPGIDTVSYALRTAALTVDLDNAADDGDGAANAGAGEDDNIRDDVDVVTGGSLGDTFTPGANPVTFNGGAGDDTCADGVIKTVSTVFVGGAGTDTYTYAGRANAVTITMGAGANDGETDELDNIDATVEQVVGGGGADTITGGTGNDTITGGAGADTLNGGGGDDVFNMGAAADGNDLVSGGAGVDTVDYSGRGAALTIALDATGTPLNGTDSGAAGEADELSTDLENVIGAPGFANTITGNASNNEIIGSSAIDTINSGGGDDTVEGKGAVDVVDCGAGDDVAICAGCTLTACEL